MQDDPNKISEKYIALIITALIVIILLCMFCGSLAERLSDKTSKMQKNQPQMPTNCIIIKQMNPTPDSLHKQLAEYLWFKKDNVNYVGACKPGVINYGPQKSWFDCQIQCQADKYCNYWSYNKADGSCYGHDMTVNNAPVNAATVAGYYSGERTQN